MGGHIIKIEPTLDLYVDWSEVIEEPVSWGPRQFMIHECGISEERLDRADKFGSSSFPGFNRWGHDDVIYKQQGILHRKNMAALLERLEKDEHADVSDLLEPFED